MSARPPRTTTDPRFHDPAAVRAGTGCTGRRRSALGLVTGVSAALTVTALVLGVPAAPASASGISGGAVESGLDGGATDGTDDGGGSSGDGWPDGNGDGWGDPPDGSGGTGNGDDSAGGDGTSEGSTDTGESDAGEAGESDSGSEGTNEDSEAPAPIGESSSEGGASDESYEDTGTGSGNESTGSSESATDPGDAASDNGSGRRSSRGSGGGGTSVGGTGDGYVPADEEADTDVTPADVASVETDAYTGDGTPEHPYVSLNEAPVGAFSVVDGDTVWVENINGVDNGIAVDVPECLVEADTGLAGSPESAARVALTGTGSEVVREEWVMPRGDGALLHRFLAEGMFDTDMQPFSLLVECPGEGARVDTDFTVAFDEQDAKAAGLPIEANTPVGPGGTAGGETAAQGQGASAEEGRLPFTGAVTGLLMLAVGALLALGAAAVVVTRIRRQRVERRR
ncbi:hypothetical protein [Brevibacterium samyangense]|uniref:LPXTG-motif cell wall anchor domain-containing protein n=1 Tax=Brevibacterium samyangense TaxID=366888 RepID=A0ABN2TF30_9MICO